MIVRFIRIEQLEEFIAQGWRVIRCGTEMATVCFSEED